MNKIAIGENIEIDVLNSKGNIKKTWGKTKQDVSTQKDGDNFLDLKKWTNKLRVNFGSVSCNGTKIVMSSPTATDQYLVNTYHMTTTASDGTRSIIKNFGFEIEPSEKYTFSYSNPNKTKTQCFIFWYKEDTSYISLSSNNIANSDRISLTATAPANAKYMCVRIDNEGYGQETTELTITNVSLKKGTDNTYSAFVPNSPSPDYPSRIRNIGDNIQLLNINATTKTVNGVNFTVYEDKSILVNGTSTNEINFALTSAMSLQNIPYTLSGCPKGGSEKSYMLRLTTTKWVSNTFDFGNGVTFKPSILNDLVLYIQIKKGVTVNNLIFKPKLEQGSIATPCTPYGCGSIDYKIEDKSNNIFNKDTDIELDGQYRGYVNGNINANQYYYGIKVKVEANSIYKVFSYQDYSNLCYFDKNMTYLNGEMFGKGAIFTTSQNCQYITLAIKKDSINEFSITQLKQIHFPLSKGQLLHEGDYIDSTEIYQKRKTRVFDGTEEWTLSSNYTNNSRFSLVCSDMKINGKILSSHFVEGTGGTDTENIDTAGNDNRLMITVRNSIATTVEQWKAYLAEQYANGTPVTVEYELAEEIVTPLTAEQQLACEQKSGIALYNGINYITTINEIKPKLEFLYELRDVKDKQIYVLNKNEELIAVLNKDDENPIFNPRIKDTQNAESVFTFSISPNNPKWEEIKNPENLYLVDDKMYSTNFEGCFQETISDNNEDYILVTAYERQKLLTRRYVRAWNSETGFETIDTFMVVVLSNGNLPLKNNDILVNSTHLSGTSGYALDALLYGTGWKTGICDVEGTFDLETDQVDIYENILKVQQIWGGILVFDSVNKIVHHRDETKYLPYNGYEVRYRKNMQSLEKLYNNKIVTKLCPLGEGGLNIKSVNNGSEWLTNFSYTDSILEGIENNPDILDSTQLKAWGERKLKDLCKPRKELTIQAILLYQVEGYELETIELNHIVDIINFANIDGDIEQLRVVSFDYGVWDYSDAVLELSDITLESTDIFKKTVSASNSINNGTLNSNKVVNFFKNGQSISTTFKNIDETIEKTTSQLSKSDEEINGKITKITTDIDSISGAVENQVKEIDDLKLTVQGLTNQYSISGGNNLIRNSVGFFNNEFWEGTIVKDTDTDVKINNESKCGFKLQSGDVAQSVNQLKNGVYNISFNYKKILTAANIKVYINEESYDLTNTDWTSFEKVITITNNKFTIKFNTDTSNSCIISDLLLVAGQAKQTWTQNANETSTDTVQIGKGIQVESDATNTYTRIDSDGNRTFSSITGNPVMEATKDGMAAETIVVRTKAEIVGLLYQKIDDQVFENLL